MDMYIRKQIPSTLFQLHHSNRIDKEEVKGFYQQRDTYTISLNDQLEHFYNKCKNNRFFKHEVTYFFHAECLLVDELQQYQTKFHKTLIQHYDKNIAQVRFS